MGGFGRRTPKTILGGGGMRRRCVLAVLLCVVLGMLGVSRVGWAAWKEVSRTDEIWLYEDRSADAHQWAIAIFRPNVYPGDVLYSRTWILTSYTTPSTRHAIATAVYYLGTEANGTARLLSVQADLGQDVANIVADELLKEDRSFLPSCLLAFSPEPWAEKKVLLCGPQQAVWSLPGFGKMKLSCSPTTNMATVLSVIPD